MGRAISELWFEAMIFIIAVGVIIQYFLVPALLVIAACTVIYLILRELV